MGKAVGKILTIGSIVGLGLVTGGIGFGLASGLTLGGSIGAVAGALGVSASTLATIGLTGLAALSSVLGKQSTRANSAESAYKGPLPERVGAYGHCGLTGAYTLYQTDPTYGVAGDAFVFHDNWWAPIDSIEGVYLGDDRVANGAGVLAGLPDGTYSDGKVEVDFRLGNRIETAFSQLVNLFGSWSNAHRGDGNATGMVTWQPVKSADYTKYYPKGQPALRLIGRWSKVYDWRDSTQVLTDPTTWQWSENPVLHDVHYELIRKGAKPTVPAVLADDDGNPYNNTAWDTQLAAILQEKWDRLFSPTLDYWTAAANDCETDTAIPIYRVLSSADNSPDSDHTIKVPNTQGLRVGMDITYTALDNIDHTETRTVSAISADGQTITISEEVAYYHPQGSVVSWKSTEEYPLYEPRYRSCVAHKLTDAHKDTQAAIRACYDGWVAPREDGALVCYSGRYYAPTVTLNPDAIVDYTIEDGIDDEDDVNELVLTYISSEHNYFAVECTPWRDDDRIAAKGKVSSQQLQIQSPSYTQNRRLAKRVMARTAAAKRGTCRTNNLGRGIIGERYITLNLIEGDTTFFSGPVEVTALKHNLQTGGVEFSWVLADPNIDSWNPATEAGDPAPVGNVVTAVALTAPTIASAVADYAQVSDDGTGVRINVTVAGLNRSDVTWELRWRVVGSATWNEASYTDIDPADQVLIQSGFVPAGETVEVEVAYLVGDGRLSNYSAAFEVDTSTDQTPPDAASAISVLGWSDSLSLSTDSISRAASYRWNIYAADGTTLIRTISSTTPQVSYTATQAATDGVSRSYVVTVAGVNAAGAGASASSGLITNAAPSQVTGVTATGGSTEGQVAFTLLSESDIAGYVIYVSNTAGFDPLTQGTAFNNNGSSPAYIQNLAAGTFYAKMAAYDAWTQNPSLLNFSAEVSFTITTGGGGVGGGSSGGGGYCPHEDTLLLLANAAHDGPGTFKRAGDFTTSDWVWTRPELDDGSLGDWGAYPVEAVEVVEADLWKANIGIEPQLGSGPHRIWLSGWTRLDQIGAAAGKGNVVRITIATAHTYFGNGLIHHNIKSVEP